MKKSEIYVKKEDLDAFLADGEPLSLEEVEMAVLKQFDVQIGTPFLTEDFKTRWPVTVNQLWEGDKMPEDRDLFFCPLRTSETDAMRERCALHLDGMAQRAESPALKAAYVLAAKQLRELK